MNTLQSNSQFRISGFEMQDSSDFQSLLDIVSQTFSTLPDA